MDILKISSFFLISGGMVLWAMKYPLPIIIIVLLFVFLLGGPINVSRSLANRIIIEYSNIFTKEEISMFLENPAYYLYPLASVQFSWAFSRSSIIQIVVIIVMLFQYRWIESVIALGLAFTALWLSIKLDPAAYANNAGDAAKASAILQLAHKCISNQLKIN